MAAGLGHHAVWDRVDKAARGVIKIALITKVQRIQNSGIGFNRGGVGWLCKFSHSSLKFNG